MLKREIILLVFIVLFVNPVLAEDYHADVSITVQTDGIVEISGESNHPQLQPGVYDTLTSKQDGYWLLNISTDEKFSHYRYKLKLPSNIKINYMGVHSVDAFEDKEGISISGSVKNKPFTMVVQYNFYFIGSGQDYIGRIIFGVLILALLFYLYKKKKKRKKYLKEHFSKREYQIIELLQKNSDCLTQAELERKTGFPKASLHRNILSLERKGTIEKSKAGMSNKIHLKRESQKVLDVPGYSG